MKTILALLSAVGLCAHGAAHSQSSAPTAPKATPLTPPASKLPALPAKPGSGQTTLRINGGGSGSVVCTNGSDGVPHCEKVEIDGKSDGDGGGEVIPNLPADNFGNQAPIQPKILPPSAGDDKLARWIKCGDDEIAAQTQSKADYDFEMARCVRDNPDSSGSIGIGVTVKGSGATVTIPWDLIRNPAAKRAECESAAKDKWQSATRYNKAVADACRAKAGRGG
ncbi:hypothetical protein [Roseateles flavus]|uniref:Uncharacterized protein n=1 Tax=Roseateles flavus TaxID=3149041 RepID=A0ABV0GBT7_9BURK